MVKFTADALVFQTNKNELHRFFGEIGHLHLIMPAEVEQWKSDKYHCSFYIKNLGTLSMEKGFVNPESEYEFIATADSRVDFTLVFRFRETIDGKLSGYFEIQTEVNPLVEMMVKRPLTNFVNMLTENLKSHLSETAEKQSDC
ncbi:MAG: hypothetical protein IH598_16935 [Bacteroidales bacterium]|nr:hypothetical protein [Bacteroidales bacterium]